jgi:starch synthase
VQDGITGFTFQEYAPAALLRTLRRALETFQDQPGWRTLQLAGMNQDHSWDRSAREYVRIYGKVGRTRGTGLARDIDAAP